MVKLRGNSGALKRSYMVTAQLHRWTVEAGVLIAEPSDIDHIGIDSGGPFAIALDVGRRQWIWTAVEILQVEPEFRARLIGSPTVR